MQRLKRLDKLPRSQLLSVSEILPIDKLSAEIQDDNEFLREVERRLQLAVQVLWAPTVWGELLQRLEDEPYVAAAERPSQFTTPLHGGRTSVTVGKWDIKAESDAWLQSQKLSLEKVYCRPFPKSKDRDIVVKENLYTPIENCLYEPVNLAAEVLELKAKYSIPPGVQAATLCDGRVLTSPDQRTILVHEIKSKRQEKHEGKHFVDLLTDPEDTERQRVARPVAQVYGYAVEEQTQYGMISSKGSYTFFKRGPPVESKSILLSETCDCSSAVRGLFLYMLHAAVTAEPMPYGKHADSPGESKLVPSDGSIGTFVPALQGSSTVAFCQQASSKRSFEDREDGGDDYGTSSDAVGTSRKHATLELRNRTVYRDATGSETLTGGQLASCIPDVDRACVTIKEAISHGKHCMVRRGTFQLHPAVYKVWEVADACAENEQDACWQEIRKEVAAYTCLENKTGAAACLGWGALHDRTMIFLAFPDYGQNLRKVHLTSQWVEAIRAAIKIVHSAGVLHNDLDLRNFVGNSPISVKLIDFACCATSGVSCDIMARQEKQFIASLMVQVRILDLYWHKPVCFRLTACVFQHQPAAAITLVLHICADASFQQIRQPTPLEDTSLF